jgi:hypothetical protein
MSQLTNALQINELKQENLELTSRIQTLEIFNRMETSKFENERAAKEKVENDLSSLLKEYNKQKEYIALLERENYSLRDALKVIL